MEKYEIFTIVDGKKIVIEVVEASYVYRSDIERSILCTEYIENSEIRTRWTYITPPNCGVKKL